MARPAGNYTVRVGSTYFNKGGKVHYVESVHPHPKYTTSSAHHDVGILKLIDKIEYDYDTGSSQKTVNKITLARKSDKIESGAAAISEGNKFRLSHISLFFKKIKFKGWGNNPDHPHAPELYRVDLKIISSQDCADKWGGDVDSYEQHEVCARGSDGADTCQVKL